MSAEKLAEALRACLDVLNELPTWSNAGHAVQLGNEALAAHEAEQEQAGEAVADWSDVRMELEAAGRVDLSVWVERNTRPQQPLSDAGIYDLDWPADVGGFDDVREIVRQVERHHGITKDASHNADLTGRPR